MSRCAVSRGRIEDMDPAIPLVASARRLLLGVSVAVLVAGGACTKPDGGSSLPTVAATTATTTSTAVVTTTTVAATEVAVLDGYRAFWAAYLKAGDPMDPNHPELSATATGAQLEQVRRAFLARLAGGEVIRGRIDTYPQLAGPVQGMTAVVADCYVDDSHLFDAGTGVQKDDPAVVTQQVRAEMILIESSWRVAAIRPESKGCTPA